MYQENENGETLYDIFCADYGDCITGVTMRDMHPIPRKFVQILPFQAIAICLEHVMPIDKEWDEMKDQDESRAREWKWSSEAGNFLHHLLIDNDGKSLVLEVGVSLCF